MRNLAGKQVRVPVDLRAAIEQEMQFHSALDYLLGTKDKNGKVIAKRKVGVASVSRRIGVDRTLPYYWQKTGGFPRRPIVMNTIIQWAERLKEQSLASQSQSRQ